MSLRTKKSSVKEPTLREDVQEIMKSLVYLYTQNRIVTKRLAAKASITGPQLSVMKMLEKLGDLSLTELSDAIRAQNSTMTGIIDRMEREELVERVRSREDRRVIRIHLTDRGRRLSEEVPVEPIAIFREAIERLDPGEIRELHKLATKVSDSVKLVIQRDFPEASAR